MKFLSKHWLQAGASALCVSAMICSGMPVQAAELDSMEEQSSQLEDELGSINQELLDLGTQIADLEDQIEATNGRSRQHRRRSISQKIVSSSSLKK